MLLKERLNNNYDFLYHNNNTLKKIETIVDSTGKFWVVSKDINNNINILYKNNYNLEVHDKPNTYGVNLWMKILPDNVGQSALVNS